MGWQRTLENTVPYANMRYVMIHDWRLGLMYRGSQLLCFIYMFAIIMMEKRYVRLEKITGATQLWGAHGVGFQHKAFNTLPYCKGTLAAGVTRKGPLTNSKNVLKCTEFPTEGFVSNGINRSPGLADIPLTFEETHYIRDANFAPNGNATGYEQTNHVWQGWRKAGNATHTPEEIKYYFAEADDVGVSINMGALTAKPNVETYMAHELLGKIEDRDGKTVASYPPSTSSSSGTDRDTLTMRQLLRACSCLEGKTCIKSGIIGLDSAHPSKGGHMHASHSKVETYRRRGFVVYLHAEIYHKLNQDPEYEYHALLLPFIEQVHYQPHIITPTHMIVTETKYARIIIDVHGYSEFFSMGTLLANLAGALALFAMANKMTEKFALKMTAEGKDYAEMMFTSTNGLTDYNAGIVPSMLPEYLTKARAFREKMKAVGAEETEKAEAGGAETEMTAVKTAPGDTKDTSPPIPQDL